MNESIKSSVNRPLAYTITLNGIITKCNIRFDGSNTTRYLAQKWK